MSKKSSQLSGESIALAFVSVGLLFSYLWSETYGSATQYVGAIIALVGVVGFFVEIEKRLRNKQFRLDNMGVGLLLLAPSLYGSFVAHDSLDGWVRMLVMAFLAFWLLFGFAGVYDFFVSLLESARRTTTRATITDALKFLTIVVTSSVAIIAALRQLFV